VIEQDPLTLTHGQRGDAWEGIADELTNGRGKGGKPLVVTGRHCRDRMEHIMEEYAKNQAKTLTLSGYEDPGFVKAYLQMCHTVATGRRRGSAR
jgi:hypothetical protein